MDIIIICASVTHITSKCALEAHAERTWMNTTCLINDPKTP